MRIRSAPQDAARRIQQFMECHDAGLSAEETADFMGMTLSNLYSWKRGMAVYRGIHLPLLAKQKPRREKRLRPTPAGNLVRRCGMSQRELARSLGVSPAAVNHWVSGRATPTHRNLLVLESIASVCGRRRTSGA